jgi:hypothetical protein
MSPGQFCIFNENILQANKFLLNFSAEICLMTKVTLFFYEQTWHFS